MDEDEAEADCKTCEVACTSLGISCSKDYQHKQEGCDDLYKACTPYAAGICYAVGAKSAGKIRSGNCFGNKEEDSTGKDTADDLTAPVATGLFPAHAAAEGNTKGDCGVNVATADSANCVGHCNNCKTKGDCGTYYSGGSGAAKEHCCSAAKESKDKCAQTFCDVLFHDV